jgi:hypothetical protein
MARHVEIRANGHGLSAVLQALLELDRGAAELDPAALDDHRAIHRPGLRPRRR